MEKLCGEKKNNCLWGRVELVLTSFTTIDFYEAADSGMRFDDLMIIFFTFETLLGQRKSSC